MHPELVAARARGIAAGFVPAPEGAFVLGHAQQQMLLLARGDGTVLELIQRFGRPVGASVCTWFEPGGGAVPDRLLSVRWNVGLEEPGTQRNIALEASEDDLVRSHDAVVADLVARGARATVVSGSSRRLGEPTMPVRRAAER